MDREYDRFDEQAMDLFVPANGVFAHCEASKIAAWGRKLYAEGLAAGAAGDAEHLACADEIRKLMRTARYKKAGKGGA